MPSEIYLYTYELDSMPEYSCSFPSATTWWKMWKSDLNAFTGNGKPPHWVVRQFVPHVTDPENMVTARCFQVILKHGPQSPKWRAPDWDNIQRWRRDQDEAKKRRTKP
jgi:hypothetical protein